MQAIKLKDEYKPVVDEALEVAFERMRPLLADLERDNPTMQRMKQAMPADLYNSTMKFSILSLLSVRILEQASLQEHPLLAGAIARTTSDICDVVMEQSMRKMVEEMKGQVDSVMGQHLASALTKES